MTRSQLLTTARKAMDNPVEVTQIGVHAYLYTSLYLKRYILIYADDSRNILGVIYKRVYYAFRNLSATEAGKRRHLCSEFNCTTFVNLFYTRDYIFKDSDGEYRNPKEHGINKLHDYSDLIPIPYKPF